MKFGLLVSGNLGYKILADLWSGDKHPSLIFTDKASVDIIKFADDNSIDCFVGNPRNNSALSFIMNLPAVPDFLLSVNYLFLLDKALIDVPTLGVVNIHGSLLPKYRGRTPHVWSIINNEKVVGVTAHYVDAGCDTGPVILQRAFDVGENDTGWSILEQFQKLYPGIVREILALFEHGTKPIGYLQDESKATYFGKRTPEDGRIVWDWQRERIRNWVRAQTDPYPGAFCLFAGEKLVVDAVEFSDRGFSFDVPNGTIIEGGLTPVVKTPNGGLRLVELGRGKINNAFKIGDRML